MCLLSRQPCGSNIVVSVDSFCACGQLVVSMLGVVCIDYVLKSMSCCLRAKFLRSVLLGYVVVASVELSMLLLVLFVLLVRALLPCVVLVLMMLLLGIRVDIVDAVAIASGMTIL